MGDTEYVQVVVSVVKSVLEPEAVEVLIVNIPVFNSEIGKQNSSKFIDLNPQV